MSKKYQVKVLVKGNLGDIEQNYLDELVKRPYLINPEVTPVPEGLAVGATVEAQDSETAEKHVQEQVWEIGHSILEDIEGYSVEKVSVTEIPSS